MYIYACMYVYMYACMHACVRACVRACVCIYLQWSSDSFPVSGLVSSAAYPHYKLAISPINIFIALYMECEYADFKGGFFDRDSLNQGSMFHMFLLEQRSILHISSQDNGIILRNPP